MPIDTFTTLTGHDSSAGAIMGTVARALRSFGVPSDVVDRYRVESISGNYDQLLQTAMKWVNVE